jgi:hypothetical protein
MSLLANAPDQQLSGLTRRQNAQMLLFFLCAAFAFILRFGISPQLMNKVVNYTEENGAFYEKLHFGTDLIFLLLPLVLFGQTFVLRGEEISLFKALTRYCIVVFALVPYLLLTGRAQSAGFILDTYLVAGVAGLIMLALNREVRRKLGDITVIILIISAAIGIVEAVTHHRIFPYDRIELTFRPVGLSVHPLALGAQCALAIGFVALARWPIWLRVAAILLLFIGCAASGARVALLLTGVEIVMLMTFVRWPRLSLRDERKAKLVVWLLTIVGGTALIAVLAAGGLLSRFGKTLFDENFMARVTIYKVFDFVDAKQIVFGMKADDLISIVNNQLHLPAIESAPVVIILLFGLPIALAFAALVVWMLLKLLRRAPLPGRIATVTFLLAAMSNNTFSSKTPELTMIVVLLLAYRSTPQSDPPAPPVTS